MAESKAPAIDSVLEVYRAAKRLGVDVVLVTGRPESQRGYTERNLRAIGCADYAMLVCMPPTSQGTTAAFKTEVRRDLQGKGRTIVANIGDQESDLSGGYAERTFKLPNVFYLTD